MACKSNADCGCTTLGKHLIKSNVNTMLPSPCPADIHLEGRGDILSCHPTMRRPT